QRILTTCAPQAIDVPLRQHSPQPGGQAAAAMEIAELGTPLPVAYVESEQLTVERVGKIAGSTRWIDGIRRAIESRPVLADESSPPGHGAPAHRRRGAPGPRDEATHSSDPADEDPPAMRRMLCARWPRGSTRRPPLRAT